MQYDWSSIVRSGVIDTLVDNYDLLFRTYRRCCDLEASDGTLATDTLVELGFKPEAAAEFCAVYNCVKSFLRQHPELTPGVEQLRALMDPQSSELCDDLVALTAGQSLAFALMCRLSGKKATSQWLWRFDIELPLRAAVCALVPTFALTPLILAPADFIELCHDFVLEYQPQSLADFMDKWHQLPSKEHADLCSYQATTGLLAGQSWSFSHPRLVHIQTTMSYISHNNTLAQFINHHLKQHLELKQDTAELTPENLPEGQDPENITEANWAQSIVTKLKAALPQGAHILFSDVYGHHITTNWIEPIVQAGDAFLLNVECRPKGSSLRHESIGPHLESVFSAPTDLHFEHNKVKLKARHLTDLPQEIEQRLRKKFPHISYLVHFDNALKRSPFYFCTNLDCAEVENFQQILIALSDLERYHANFSLKLGNARYFSLDYIDWKKIMAQLRSALRKANVPATPEFSFLGSRGLDLDRDFSGMLKLVSYLAQR